MPKDHARKTALNDLKERLGVKHHDAIAILDDPRTETIVVLIEGDWAETYAEAVDHIEDPRNQTLCETCGWTVGMVCPECPGCGCYNGRCTGWRHWEDMESDPDYEPQDECDCGYVGNLDSGEHVYNCVC